MVEKASKDTKKLEKFWEMWNKNWKEPPETDRDAWNEFVAAKRKLSIPEYQSYKHNGSWFVFKGTPVPDGPYDHPVLRSRWNMFWKALAWKLSDYKEMQPPDESLLVNFDKGLSYILRKTIIEHPSLGLAALAEDDLRFYELGEPGSTAGDKILEILSIWLSSQKDLDNKLRGTKSPGGKKSRPYFRLINIFKSNPELAECICRNNGRERARVARNALKLAGVKILGGNKDKNNIAICCRAARSYSKSRNRLVNSTP